MCLALKSEYTNAELKKFNYGENNLFCLFYC